MPEPTWTDQADSYRRLLDALSRKRPSSLQNLIRGLKSGLEASPPTSTARIYKEALGEILKSSPVQRATENWNSIGRGLARTMSRHFDFKIDEDSIEWIETEECYDFSVEVELITDGEAQEQGIARETEVSG